MKRLKNNVSSKERHATKSGKNFQWHSNIPFSSTQGTNGTGKWGGIIDARVRSSCGMFMKYLFG